MALNHLKFHSIEEEVDDVTVWVPAQIVMARFVANYSDVLDFEIRGIDVHNYNDNLKTTMTVRYKGPQIVQMSEPGVIVL
jgi:hypothetical protein